jgi:IgGFc binding protein
MSAGARVRRGPLPGALRGRGRGPELERLRVLLPDAALHPELSAILLRHVHRQYVTSTLPLEVSLELDGKSIDVSNAMYRTNSGDAKLIKHTGPIAPGESTILFVADRDPDVMRPPTKPAGRQGCPYGVVPAAYVESPLPNGTGFGTAFHLRTNVPAGLTAIYPFGGAATMYPTAMLLLPVTSWAKENIIVNGWELTPGSQPAAQILASEDGTEVTVIPTKALQGGAGVTATPAKAPMTYRLDKGQLLQLVQSEELSGSIVSSSKPTSVVGGHSCANIPSRSKYCDVLAQQLPAFEQWGSEYVGVGYRPRLGNEHEQMPYRIVAARDGTRLDYDPAVPAGAPLTLSAGEMATFYAGTGDPFVVRTQDSEHPIYLAALMVSAEGDGFGNGADFGGNGDPEFVNVVPAGQYLSSYSFYADPTYAETSLVVVRAKTDGQFKDVSLECAGTLTGFQPVGTRGDYEFLRVDLARKNGPGQAFGDRVCRNGLQRMASDGAFTATLWGWDRYASYAYPGGLAQRKLVTTPLSTVH